MNSVLLRRYQVDVAVIGSGITGLLIARAAARFGYSVALIEQAATISSGATSQNEGWLHHGTYHSISIAARRSAISVAKRCAYGARRLAAIAPEAIEAPLEPSYAFTTWDSEFNDMESRWNDAGVQFNQVPLRTLSRALPELNVKDIKRAYEVQDRAINTTALAGALIADCTRLGVQVIRKTTVSSYCGQYLQLRRHYRNVRLAPRFIYVACGTGTVDVSRRLGLDLTGRVRYWKSHMVFAPKFVSGTAISLDPGDISSINHGSATVIGMNEDVVRVAQTTVKPDSLGQRSIMDAISQRLVVPVPERSILSACTKIDLTDEEGKARSLAPTAVALRPTIIALFPGKMTEAPYLVDRAILLAVDALGLDGVTPRGYDKLANRWRLSDGRVADTLSPGAIVEL